MWVASRPHSHLYRCEHTELLFGDVPEHGHLHGELVPTTKVRGVIWGDVTANPGRILLKCIIVYLTMYLMHSIA